MERSIISRALPLDQYASSWSHRKTVSREFDLRRRREFVSLIERPHRYRPFSDFLARRTNTTHSGLSKS